MDAIVQQPAPQSRKINFSAAPIQFDFDFYDLPIIPGLYANGTAEISVHADGVNDEPEYFIGRIFLHGEQNKPEEVLFDDTGIQRTIYMEIWGALDSGSLASRVTDAAVEKILERA
jgi:hypothetical protein